jgi:hypothetical protein
MERIIGAACAGWGWGACARTISAPNNAQIEATQTANCGGRIHPETYLIG